MFSHRFCYLKIDNTCGSYRDSLSKISLRSPYKQKCRNAKNGAVQLGIVKAKQATAVIANAVSVSVYTAS